MTVINFQKMYQVFRLIHLLLKFNNLLKSIIYLYTLRINLTLIFINENYHLVTYNRNSFSL